MHVLTSLAVLATLLAPAAAPGWQKVFGWDKQSGTRTQDFDGAIFAQPNGDLLLVSNSSIENTGKSGMSLARLDRAGKLLWHRWTGYDLFQFNPQGMIQTRDGGILGGGNCIGDGCLTKFDRTGKELWRRSYEFENGTATPDFISERPSGELQVYFDGIVDHWVTLDASGNKTEDRVVAFDTGGLVLSQTKRTADGGFVLVGTNHPGVPEDATPAQRKAIEDAVDLVVVKVDADWQTEWRKTYGGPKAESAMWLEVTADGGFVVAGGTESFGRKGMGGYLLRLDGRGNKQWERVFGSNAYTFAMQVGAVDDGYLVSGNYGLGDDQATAFLKKFDPAGKPLWEKTYPCGYADKLVFAQDGGFFLFGHAVGKCGANWIDLYLIKTDAQGETSKR